MGSPQPVFFKDWPELGRTLLLAITAYSGFLLVLRISGKRTITKMNVFDFVFVVALGSMLGNTILSTDITLSNGLVGIIALVLLQMVFSWLSLKSNRIEQLINGHPSLLFFRGKFLKSTMARERVTEEEIRAAIRSKGLGPVEAVRAVVLETDGSFSVVWQLVDQSDSSLCDVAQDEKERRQAEPVKEDIQE